MSPIDFVISVGQGFATFLTDTTILGFNLASVIFGSISVTYIVKLFNTKGGAR